MSTVAQKAYDQYFGENRRSPNRFSSEYIDNSDENEFVNSPHVQKFEALKINSVEVSYSVIARWHIKSHISEDNARKALYLEPLVVGGQRFAHISGASAKTTPAHVITNPFVFCAVKRGLRARAAANERPQTSRVMKADALVDIFNSLADSWQKETSFTSSLSDIVMHPAYQRIIGLGPDVLPLVLKYLEVNGGHWFAALQALTGENPVKEEDSGRVRRMRDSWLEWGRQNNLI